MSAKFPEREFASKGFSQPALEWLRAINNAVTPGTISLDVTELEALQHEFRLLRNSLDQIADRVQGLEVEEKLPPQVIRDLMANVIVRDASTGDYMSVDANNRGNVVQHRHPDSTYLHFDFDFTGGTGYDFILIDLSDTTNWKHTNTGAIHLEELYVEVDAEVNADYLLSFGFLANVDATDGDFYELTHISGTKTVGQQKEIIRKFYPNGPVMSTSNIVTSDISANDTAFQTDVNLRSTIDTTTATVPSGSGDFVLRVNAGAGGANTNFSVEVNLSYHTHA